MDFCLYCCSLYLSPFDKQNLADQDFKACWSFCFELKVLNESKFSMSWGRCAFGNAWRPILRPLYETKSFQSITCFSLENVIPGLSKHPFMNSFPASHIFRCHRNNIFLRGWPNPCSDVWYADIWLVIQHPAPPYNAAKSPDLRETFTSDLQRN